MSLPAKGASANRSPADKSSSIRSSVPSVRSRIRCPPHGERRAAIQHPRPVHPLVDFRRQIFDFLIGKVLPGREHATKQKRSINGGELTLFPALPGFHVNEVKEEPVLVRQIV